MNLFVDLLLFGQLRAKDPRPGDWSFGWLSVGIVAAVALAIILAAWLFMRWLTVRERTITNSPWRLFKDLCAAHAVDGRERQLLVRMAKEFRLEQPAILFVEPAWFERERLGAAFASYWPAIEKLKKRMFALR